MGSAYTHVGVRLVLQWPWEEHHHITIVLAFWHSDCLKGLDVVEGEC
jgi:hypothetical protein